MLGKLQQNNSKAKFFHSPLWYLVGLLIVLLAVYCLFHNNLPQQQADKFLAQLIPSQNTSSLHAPCFLSKPGVAPQIAGLNIIDRGFLESSGPPFLVEGQVLASLATGGAIHSHQDEVQEYIVQQGDTLSDIAEKFGISLNTVLWANDLSRNSTIQSGKKLVILPVSGVMHIVRKRETISQLAQDYQTKAEEIVQFNGLQNPDDIFAGDLLILPGAEMPRRAYSYSRVPLSKTAFICPIPEPCRITQGLHWFNAVDFSNGQCGEPVYAAAGGKVQRIGHHKIAGNYVRLIHNSGAVTFYGHLSKITTAPGAWVSQGAIIGYTGHTGYTIPAGPAGCHLHFDVRFATNPFAK